MSGSVVYLAFLEEGWLAKTVIIPDISVATIGFWINRNKEYTQGSDARYWIPPSGIRFVEKFNGP